MLGVGTGPKEPCSTVGPMLNSKYGEWKVKGRVASQKRLEIRKVVVDSVGQFDFAVLGLGLNLRKAHSVGANLVSNLNALDVEFSCGFYSK